MVSRLSNPYGDCKDPNDVDKSHNAYAEHFPVVYTAQVMNSRITLYIMVFKYFLSNAAQRVLPAAMAITSCTR